jgi:hypothetical protein
MCLIEAYSKIRDLKHLIFRTVVLLPLIFNTTLAYQKLKDNQYGLELNGKCQLLVCVKNVNLSRENIQIKRIS